MGPLSRMGRVVYDPRIVSRYSPYASGIQFGPGPLTPAVKGLIIANVGVFLASSVVFSMSTWLGLTPERVFSDFAVWQPVTYMFLHGGLGHLLFNMLGLWMFGVELERRWRTEAFLKFYAVCGTGAALFTIALSLLPFAFSGPMYVSTTVGASGALYGLLLAYGLYYPDRQIYFYGLFPIAARYFVMIIGAISFYMSVMGSRSGVAHAAHLGGLLVGYLYLTAGTGGPMAEIKYRYLKWKMSQARKRFDVHQGGRGGWSGKVH